jgi:signal transduction histidine kinase
MNSITTLAKKVWEFIKRQWERQPVLVSAFVIFGYYVLTSFNLFRHHTERQTLLDYVMDFDSLFFLWIAAMALLQMQKYRAKTKVEEENRRNIERVLDRQQLYSQLVNDITTLLQDNVNNPLAVISVTTQEMRRKFFEDNEMIRWLDRIESAMQRIHHTIRDLQAYEAQKLIDSTGDFLHGQKQKAF